MKNLFILYLVAFATVLNTQAQGKFNISDDFHIIDNQSFSGSTLYGHINGGAELFLEYGFENLNYFLVSKNKTEYSLDIYRMRDPFSAYGIFSIKRFKCMENELPVRFYCQTSYQLSVQKAEYFITIANDKGSAEAMEESKILAGQIVEDIINSCINIPVFAENFLFEIPSFVILLKGPLGFQNGLPGWETFFEGFNSYDCFYQDGMYQGKKVEFFQVFFQSENDAKSFMKSKAWKTSKDFQDKEKTWYAKQFGSQVIFAKGNIKLVSQ